MLWIYFDASALIKRYSQEAGTPLVNEVFKRLPPHQMTCSLLGVLEIISILVRKRNDGRLDPMLFEQAMTEFKAEVIDHEEFLATSVDDAIILSSLDLIAKHNLNSSDAIILRSALNLINYLNPKEMHYIYGLATGGLSALRKMKAWRCSILKSRQSIYLSNF